MDWKKLASKEIIEKTIKNLNERGINALLTETGAEAKGKAVSLLPAGSRVLVSTSRTADAIGLTEEIENSGKYKSVRKEYMALNHETEGNKIRELRTIPEYIVGSVHAVTEDGEVVIASNTGSQLGAYVYGAQKVIWVVGTQKIVKNLDEAFKRIYEYVLPLESERLEKQAGIKSNVSKLLIVNKEVVKGRVTLIFINQALGF